MAYKDKNNVPFPVLTSTQKEEERKFKPLSPYNTAGVLQIPP